MIRMMFLARCFAAIERASVTASSAIRPGHVHA